MADAPQFTKCRALVPFIYPGGMVRPGEIIDMPSGTPETEEKLDQLVLCKVLKRVVAVRRGGKVRRGDAAREDGVARRGRPHQDRVPNKADVARQRVADRSERT